MMALLLATVSLSADQLLNEVQRLRGRVEALEQAGSGDPVLVSSRP